MTAPTARPAAPPTTPRDRVPRTVFRCGRCAGGESHYGRGLCRDCFEVAAELGDLAHYPGKRNTRAGGAPRAYCVHGHRMTRRNTYRRPNGYTYCRACVLGTRRRRRAERRAA